MGPRGTASQGDARAHPAMTEEDDGARRAHGVLFVLLAAILWGAMGIFARWAYAHGVAPLEAVSVRATVAFLALLLLHARRPSALRIPAADVPFYAAFGAVSIAAFYYLYFAALARVSVAVAAALLYTAPAFAVVLARVVFGEPLTGRKAAALTVALVGVFLVTGAWRGGELDPAGILLGLGAGLTYALFTLFGKRSAGRQPPTVALVWALGFGAVILGVLVPPWRAPLDHPGAIPALLCLALLSTAAASVLYLAGLQRLQAGVAALLATIEPVVAALLAMLLLGEPLGLVRGLGIGLVVAAAVLAARGRPGTAAAARASGAHSRPGDAA